MISTYHATFSSMPGISIVMIILSALMVGVGSIGSSLFLVICGIALLIFLVLVRVRLKVVITPMSLEYTGIFSTKKILFSEIEFAKRAADTSYVASRLSGPYTYELQTSSDTVRINLKLFPLELSHKLFELVDIT
jgi:hypothetical protein